MGPLPHVSISDYETSQEVFVKNGNKYKDRFLPPIFEAVSRMLPEIQESSVMNVFRWTRSHRCERRHLGRDEKVHTVGIQEYGSWKGHYGGADHGGSECEVR